MEAAECGVYRFAVRNFNNFYARGWLILLVVMLMWAANIVAGRLAVGQISPMALVSLRWLIVSVFMILTQRGTIRADLVKLKSSWLLLFLGGALGFTGFNALFYAGAHYTSGVNIAIIQGSVPVFTMLGALIVFRTRFSGVQFAGLTLTLAGIVVVATKGDLFSLSTLRFNMGDVEVLLACAFYAAYTLALRNRPKISALGLFAVMAGVAFATSVPLLAWEIYSGDFFWPTPTGWFILLYIALFPSLISQIFFIRGVELVGPARAGLFVNLIPVLGAIMSIIFLGEAFAVYHILALGLVLAGICIAERVGR